jgi:hypothetical protein
VQPVQDEQQTDTSEGLAALIIIAASTGRTDGSIRPGVKPTEK